MSNKYMQAFDSLRSDEYTKNKRIERILSAAQGVCADEVTVQAGAASAVKARRHILIDRRYVAPIIAMITIVIVSIVVLVLSLLPGSNSEPVGGNIYDLMKDARMVNENFIGFSLSGARNTDAQEKNKSAAPGVAYADEADNNGAGGLIAITEDLQTEEVRFKKPNSAEEITNEDINKFGAITQFYVMNNLLYIEITAHEVLNTTEVRENSYFRLGFDYAVFVVDLDSKLVYSLNDVVCDTDFGEWNFEARSMMFIWLRNGLLFTNPDIVNHYPHMTFYIDVHDNKLELKKVSDIAWGLFLQDIHKNIYLLIEGADFSDSDAAMFNTEYIDFLRCDNLKYQYFISTDKQIYRALRSNWKAFGNKRNSFGEYYYDVESLQKDKTWHKETSSSDKMLRDELATSNVSYAGGWMLKDGKIVRISYANNRCYNVDGKILAHIKNSEKGEEAILYICEESEVTTDFKCIDFEVSYDDYDRVVSYATDSYIYRFDIQIIRGRYVLYEYDVTQLFSDIPPQKYIITVNDGNIELAEIKPIYNGLEVVSEIIFVD